MQRVSVVLETITPLFLAGADPHGEPELRAPSVRGALRYWLRALLGGVYGDDHWGLEKIRQKETEIWGDTKSGSNLVCQVRKLHQPSGTSLQLDQKNRPGETYLLWANSTREGARKYLNEGSFELLLKPRLGGKMNEQNLNVAAASLWLLLNLGGLGTRSRRLMGSLRVKAVKDWPDSLPSPDFKCNEPNALAERLVDSIRQLRRLVSGEVPAKFSSNSAFDILHPDHAVIYVWNQKKMIQALIEDFGNDLQKRRLRTPPDYQAVLDIIHGKKSSQRLLRPGFGLPLQFFFRSEFERILRENRVAHDDSVEKRKLRPKATATLEPWRRGHEDDESKQMSRRASPVHFHVSTLNEVDHTIVATFFKSRFLPDHTQIRVKPGNREQKPWALDFGGYDLVEAYFQEKEEAREVYRLNFASSEVKK